MGLVGVIANKLKARKAIGKFNFAVENIRRKERGESPLRTCGQKMRGALSVIYPPFKEDFEPSTAYQRIFKRGTKENSIYRLLRNYILLEIFGFLIFSVIAMQYVSNPREVGTLVSASAHLLTVLLMFMPCIMKIIVLYVYKCIASKSAAVLILIVVALAFEVPCMNTTQNIANVAEGVGCVAGSVRQTADDAKGKSQEALDKIPDTELGKLVTKMMNAMGSLKARLRTLGETVTRITDTIKAHYEAIVSITRQCSESFRNPYRKCISTVNSMYTECEYSTPLAGCKVLHKLTGLCDAAKHISESVCQFPGTVKNGLTEGVVPFIRDGAEPLLDSIRQSLVYKIGRGAISCIKNCKSLGVEYNMTDTASDKHTLFSAKKIHKKFKEALSGYFGFISALSFIVRYILMPFTLIWPFFKTCKFVYMFNTREDFKNTLLTSEFERIDISRALKGYERILPLTNIEKEKYGRLWTGKMNSTEKATFFFRTFFTITAMALPIMFIAIDIAVYKILKITNIILKSVKLDVPDHFELKVSGNGTIAQVVNGVLETFQPISDAIVKNDKKWRECFREPTEPDYDTVYLIIMLFFAALALHRFQIFLNRGVIVIANAFFPDRRRPRALSLYFTILEHRQNLLSSIMMTKKHDMGVEKMLAHEKIVRRGMQSRGLLRVPCAKCALPDMRVADACNVRSCTACSAFYCITCYSFLRKCLLCDDEMQIIEGIEMYYEREEIELMSDDTLLKDAPAQTPKKTSV